jgi:hypothetical protein
MALFNLPGREWVEILNFKLVRRLAISPDCFSKPASESLVRISSTDINSVAFSLGFSNTFKRLNLRLEFSKRRAANRIALVELFEKSVTAKIFLAAFFLLFCTPMAIDDTGLICKELLYTKE